LAREREVLRVPGFWRCRAAWKNKKKKKEKKEGKKSLENRTQGS
jgi:hypothetical protein